MKKYSVYTLFKNGRDMQFESIDNPLEIDPVNINGKEIIITEEHYVINLLAAEHIEVVEIGHGIVVKLTAQ